ncbi:MAG TPA: NAD-dependent epimerase/dehydratase family protein [Puia sp.]
MQTILGANGAIGSELAKALKTYTNKIRIVGRSPKKINESDELFAADLTDAAQVGKAIEGSEIVYLTIGFEYKLKVWQKNWPKLMSDVIASCKKHKAKLVFFDNIYLYDKSEIPHMTENSRINPPGKKGKVRAEIAKMILDEVEKGKLTALIARSADFYGPDSNNNITRIIFDDFKKGKKASWLVNATKQHNFTYTPDAGKATALLGNTADAFNQVWHLPTTHEKINGQQWIEAIAKEMNVSPKYQVLPVWLMGVLGIFMPQIRELKEISYQSDRDYFFDSSKFEKRFGINPTSVETGISETIKSFSK